MWEPIAGVNRGWDLASWLEKLRYLVIPVLVGEAESSSAGSSESTSQADLVGVSAMRRREEIDLEV